MTSGTLQQGMAKVLRVTTRPKPSRNPSARELPPKCRRETPIIQIHHPQHTALVARHTSNVYHSPSSLFGHKSNKKGGGEPGPSHCHATHKNSSPNLARDRNKKFHSRQCGVPKTPPRLAPLVHTEQCPFKLSSHA